MFERHDAECRSLRMPLALLNTINDPRTNAAAIGFNAISQYMNENLPIIQYVGGAYRVYTGVTMRLAMPPSSSSDT